MHCICLCAWGSGKPADHEAGAMVFRHAGGIAAVVSAPHRLLVYRPVRRAPPHQSTLCIFLKIGNLLPLISLEIKGPKHEPRSRWARTTSAKGATGAGACRRWARGNHSYTELVPRQRAGVPGVRARDCGDCGVGRRETRRETGQDGG